MLQKDKKCFVQNVKARMVRNRRKIRQREDPQEKKWGQNKPLLDVEAYYKVRFYGREDEPNPGL